MNVGNDKKRLRRDLDIEASCLAKFPGVIPLMFYKLG